jgi:hypothetical protein
MPLAPFFSNVARSDVIGDLPHEAPPIARAAILLRPSAWEGRPTRKQIRNKKLTAG